MSQGVRMRDADLLMLAILVSLAPCLFDNVSASAAEQGKPSKRSEETALKEFQSLSRLLRDSRELHADLQITYLMAGFGGSVPQGPVQVQIAWQRPSELHLHEQSDGDNPDRWYWLKDNRLSIYEELPVKNDKKIQARGVSVNNLRQLTGTAEGTFSQAYRYAEHYTVTAYAALRYLEMLRNVPTDSLEVAQTSTGWEMTVDRQTMEKQLPAWMRRADEKGEIVFVFIETEDGLKLNAIQAATHPEMLKARIGVQFDQFRLNLDRTKIGFPDVKSDRLKPMDLERIEDLDEDIMYLPLVLKPKAEIRFAKNPSSEE